MYYTKYVQKYLEIILYSMVHLTSFGITLCSSSSSSSSYVVLHPYLRAIKLSKIHPLQYASTGSGEREGGGGGSGIQFSVVFLSSGEAKGLLSIETYNIPNIGTYLCTSELPLSHQLSQ